MDLDPQEVQEFEDTTVQESLSNTRTHISTEQICPIEYITNVYTNMERDIYTHTYIYIHNCPCIQKAFLSANIGSYLSNHYKTVNQTQYHVCKPLLKENVACIDDFVINCWFTKQTVLALCNHHGSELSLGH